MYATIQMKHAEKHLALVNKYVAMGDIPKAKGHYVRANELLGFGWTLPFLEFLKKSGPNRHRRNNTNSKVKNHSKPTLLLHDSPRRIEQDSRRTEENPKAEDKTIDCKARTVDLDKWKLEHTECRPKDYRNISLQIHPDKNIGCKDVAERMFKDLGEHCARAKANK